MKKNHLTTKLLVATLLSASSLASAQSLSQNISYVVSWDVQVAIDAAKAKKNPGAAKAVEGTLGLIGGSIGVATMTDRLSFNNGSYAIVSQAKANALISSLLPNSTATRTSRGRSDGAYMTSVQFTEERTKGHERKVVLDYAKKTSAYFKSGQSVKQEALPYRTADTASLPYLFYKKALPTGPITIAATDGLSTRLFRFAPSADNVTIGKQNIPALKLTHQPSSPNEAGLSLWIRKSDGFPLRIRLDMNARYGAIMDQKLKELPTGI